MNDKRDIIVCEGVKKWFGDFQALKGITTSVGEQEVVVVIGPSGSGKSTFIRTLNRLEVHQDVHDVRAFGEEALFDGLGDDVPFADRDRAVDEDVEVHLPPGADVTRAEGVDAADACGLQGDGANALALLLRGTRVSQLLDAGTSGNGRERKVRYSCRYSSVG